MNLIENAMSKLSLLTKVSVCVAGWLAGNSVLKQYYLKKETSHETQSIHYVLVKKWYSPVAEIYRIPFEQTELHREYLPPQLDLPSKLYLRYYSTWKDYMGGQLQSSCLAKIKEGTIQPCNRVYVLPGLSTTTIRTRLEDFSSAYFDTIKFGACH